MSFAISRHWHKSPGWFDGLSRELQLELMADFSLSHKDEEDDQRARWREARRELFSEGCEV